MANPETTPSSVKTALITGGSRGLGRSTVLALAARGIPSLFTYHNSESAAREVEAAARQQGVTAIALPLDAGNVDGFARFQNDVTSALKTLGTDRLDYLVNNAGNHHRNMPFEQTTEAELDSLYTVHFKGVFLLTQRLLPLLRDGGRIVNISTGRTRISMPGGAAYASMKGAVEVLTRHMAKELGPRGIAVNVVAPGAVATDFSGGVVRDNPAVNKMVADNTALGRAGVPDDIGPMIASLLSDDHRWVNGQRIEVSGGMVL